MSAPLTAAQQQIWYLERMLPGRPVHTESRAVLLEGALDPAALHRAFQGLVDRHQALRSVVVERDGEPRLVPVAEPAVPLPVEDRTGGSVDDALAAVLAEETAHRFDLAVGPLFAPRLLRLGPERALLVLRMHHLVMDAASLDVMAEELAALYRGAGDLPPAPPLPTTDTSLARPEDLVHWQDLLCGASVLEVPADRPRPARASGRGDAVDVVLDHEVAALRALAERHDVTLFTVLLAAQCLALHRATGRRDLVVGVPVSHRPPGTERAVGFFVTTLPLRVRVPEDGEPAELLPALLSAVREQVVLGRAYAAPLPQIVQAVGGTADPLRNPLFEIVVNGRRGLPLAIDLPGVTATPLPQPVRRAPFELATTFTELDATVHCRLEFATDRYDRSTAVRLVERFRQVVGELTGPAPPRVLLPQEEASIASWCDGGPPHPDAELLHELPGPDDRVAVVDERGTVTATQFSRRCDAVAAALRRRRLPAGTPVGVHLPRSTDALVAFTAVLRAGLAYVPLDPAQPVERNVDLVARAQAPVVLVRAGAEGPWPDGVATLAIDAVDAVDGPLADGPPAAAPGPEDPAYVLFTSGSTGRPKGCVLQHRSVANALHWYVEDLGITSADRISWYGSPGFDASGLDFWAALRTGASLHVVPDAARLDPERLARWMDAVGITAGFLPTPVAELLLETDGAAGLTRLRHLATGGDRLRRRPWPGLPFTVWNYYGPTETAIIATRAVVAPHGAGLPTIGRPGPGVRVAVLDERGGAVPIGVPGVLHIGGVQVSPGYLGDPGETARRFVGTRDAGRAFRTGDIVSWRSTGELDYHGRDDAQIQVRGFRVEPAEAEQALQALPDVRDAVVRGWTDDDGGGFLAAYVSPSALDVDDLRRRLARRLPAHLVPVAWVVLPELPLTANGKLDRAALARPAFGGGADTDAPATDTERRLQELWSTHLGVADVGVRQSFFDLGGHSLSATTLLHRIRAEFGRGPDVPDFLQAPTIRDVAAGLDQAPEPVPSGTADHVSGTI